MTKYTIYAKREKVKDIRSIVAEHFGIFTFTKTLYRGWDKIMVIDIIAYDGPHAERSVRLLCQKIKGLQRQDNIVFTKQELNYEVVE